jgi:hypothetical protein
VKIMFRFFSGLSNWDQVEIVSLAMALLGTVFSLWLKYKRKKPIADKNGLIPVALFFKKEELESKKGKLELFWEIILILGLFSAIPVAWHKMSEITRLENHAEELSVAIIQLAHQYDLSTNALAEANARLLSVANLAAMNSPKNFPIKSIAGYGVIGINKKDSALFSKARMCPIALELINNETGSARKSNAGRIPEIINFEGRVDSAEINGLGEMILKFTVNGERRKTPGIWSNVTFNNVGSVRADFVCTNPEPPFVIEGGFLDLTLDSLDDVRFQFSAQTNEIGGEWGVVGVRVRNQWEP